MRSKVIGCGWALLMLSSCQIGMGPPSYIPERALQPSTTAPVTSPALTSPVPSPSVSTGDRATAPLQPAPSATSSDIVNSNPLPQTLPSAVAAAPVVSGVLSGSGSSGGNSSTVEPSFFISDVVLTDTGKSVMGENALVKIHADYTSDALISLTLKGKFKGLSNLPISAKQFSYEAGLIYQSYEGDQPILRVLLDQSLILEVINFSENHLEVLLPQRDVTELYLQGGHNLTVYAGSQKTQSTLWVGEPKNPILTFPQIISAEPIDLDGQAGLLVKGHFFLLNPSWQSVEVDEKRVTVQRVDTLSNGQSLLWITLPETLLPDVYLIRYTSPMGVTQFSLEVS